MRKKLIDADKAKQLARESLRKGTYALRGLFQELLWESSDRIKKRSDNMDMYGLPWSITGVKPKRLPQGTRFVLQSNSAITYIVEQPPQVRTIHFSKELMTLHYWQNPYRIEIEDMFAKDQRLGKKRHFHLALPYVIFVIHLSVDNEGTIGLMYFSNKPFVSMEQLVFQPCLPNVSSDGSLCLPDNLYNDAGLVVDSFIKEGRYSEAVDLIIDRIWKATFNKDIIDCFDEITGSCLRSLWHWERNSRENPLFVLNIKWNNLDPPETVAEQVRSIMWNSTEYDNESIDVIRRIVVRELEKNNRYAGRIKKTIRQIRSNFDSALDREIKLTQNENMDAAHEPDTYSRVGSGQATKAKERRRK